MPFGISESAIAKAYGPTDLSGFYKSIDAASKRYDAQTKLQKQALQKEYYTSLAVLNKDQNGINPKDSPAFISHFNKFKSAQQSLIANPNLIDSNPEEYGRLTAASNESYGNASQLANASKLMQKKITSMHDYAYKNPDKFEDGALEKIAGLSQLTTQEIIDGGLDDVSKYAYEGPNLEKFNKGIKDIYGSKDNNITSRINSYTDEKAGATVYNMYSIPNILKIQEGVSGLLASQKNPTRAASTILEKFGSQVDDIQRMYENLSDDDFSKFKTAEGKDTFPLHHPFNDVTKPETRKPDLMFNTDNPQMKLNAFLVARPIIAGITNPKQEGKQNLTEFAGGDVGKKKYTQDLAFELQNQMEQIRQRNRIINIKQGYLTKRDLVQADREQEAKFKLLVNLVGTQTKLDLKYGDELDDKKLEEVNTLLDKITGTTKKTAKKKAY